LARELNRDEERIPQPILTKEPSAELSPNQKDSDTLPPYEKLDPLIEALVDLSLPVDAAAKRAKVSPKVAREIARRVDASEYKRRQMPPGPKVTAKAFGEGRRYPIAHRFRA
ncbi:MAG TPA: NAD+ synthase, partial [Thermoanaerobaculia bacterium]